MKNMSNSHFSQVMSSPGIFDPMPSYFVYLRLIQICADCSSAVARGQERGEWPDRFTSISCDAGTNPETNVTLTVFRSGQPFFNRRFFKSGEKEE
jgi:hypothetical protein